uniref:Uncharacterized protein n=1 Tax=Ignisphaera aggregans TaxID=334771 RepID=A0A7C2Z211_9CREN
MGLRHGSSTVRMQRGSRGLSDIVAVVLFMGIALVLMIGLWSLLSSSYASDAEARDLLNRLSYERSNVVVRVVGLDSEEYSATVLMRRLDGGNTIFFFVDNGTRYLACDKAVLATSGNITARAIDIDSVYFAREGAVYEFKYEAKALGYPIPPSVLEICELRSPDRNPMVKLYTGSQSFRVYVVAFINNKAYVAGVYEFAHG